MLNENSINKVPEGTTTARWKELSNNCCALLPYSEFHFFEMLRHCPWAYKDLNNPDDLGRHDPGLLFNP